MAKEMKFELVGGNHSNAVANYKKGDIVPSHSDLEKIFPNKFKRRLDLESVQAAPPPPPPSDDDDSDDDDGDEDTLVQSSLGSDVTAEFEEAGEAELLVFKDAKGKFHVADPEDPEKALNDKPLTKTKVAAFVDDYLE